MSRRCHYASGIARPTHAESISRFSISCESDNLVILVPVASLSLSRHLWASCLPGDNDLVNAQYRPCSFRRQLDGPALADPQVQDAFSLCVQDARVVVVFDIDTGRPLVVFAALLCSVRDVKAGEDFGSIETRRLGKCAGNDLECFSVFANGVLREA
jgi:hypothetical protein